MSEEETRELKSYIKNIVGGHVIADNFGYCRGCGEWRDLRYDHCFNCVFTECPLEKCEFSKLVYNANRERVVKDMRYIDRKTGKQYCDHSDGLCATAKNILKIQSSTLKEQPK